VFWRSGFGSSFTPSTSGFFWCGSLDSGILDRSFSSSRLLLTGCLLSIDLLQSRGTSGRRFRRAFGLGFRRGSSSRSHRMVGCLTFRAGWAWGRAVIYYQSPPPTRLQKNSPVATLLSLCSDSTALRRPYGLIMTETLSSPPRRSLSLLCLALSPAWAVANGTLMARRIWRDEEPMSEAGRVSVCVSFRASARGVFRIDSRANRIRSA
jgi:hypothetical protein